MTWDVFCNGVRFASFESKQQADDYVDMQRSKIKGAGLAPKPLTGDESLKYGAYAAKQRWEAKRS